MLAACGSVALSARSVGSARSKPDKSITATAASRMKKALGLKSKTGGAKRGGKARTTPELLRDQMLISEQADMRTRRALSRAAAGQVGVFSPSLFQGSQLTSKLVIELINCHAQSLPPSTKSQFVSLKIHTNIS